jgi:hypothetical protein
MTDYQPIDYRLRCHTKRTDLPVDVLRDIGEAYAEIQRLQRMLADIKQGFEGCCNACEPVGEMNKKLREERDEARREVCWFHHLTGFLAGDYANSRGWDCFPNRDNEFEPSVNDFKEFLKAQDKIFLERVDRLTAERDEARRLVCRHTKKTYRTLREMAEEREWDCFDKQQ